MEQKVWNKEHFCILVCLQITLGSPQDSITVWLKGDDVYKFGLRLMHLQENSAAAAALLMSCRNQRQAEIKEVKTRADGQGGRTNADSHFRAQTPSTGQWQVLLAPCLHQRHHIRCFFQGTFPEIRCSAFSQKLIHVLKTEGASVGSSDCCLKAENGICVKTNLCVWLETFIYLIKTNFLTFFTIGILRFYLGKLFKSCLCESVINITIK